TGWNIHEPRVARTRCQAVFDGLLSARGVLPSWRYGAMRRATRRFPPLCWTRANHNDSRASTVPPAAAPPTKMGSSPTAGVSSSARRRPRAGGEEQHGAVGRVGEILPAQGVERAHIPGPGERRLSGAFNVVGETIPLPAHLALAREVVGHTGPVVAVGQDWLAAHDVQPSMGERSLPLWLPMPEHAGFSSRDGSAARAAGLPARPLDETRADALAWELGRNPQRPRLAGLSDPDDRRLLHALTAS